MDRTVTGILVSVGLVTVFVPGTAAAIDPPSECGRVGSDVGPDSIHHDASAVQGVCENATEWREDPGAAYDWLENQTATEAPTECYAVDSSTGTGWTWFVDDAVHSGCDNVGIWSGNHSAAVAWVEDRTGVDVPAPPGPGLVVTERPMPPRLPGVQDKVHR